MFPWTFLWGFIQSALSYHLQLCLLDSRTGCPWEKTWIEYFSCFELLLGRKLEIEKIVFLRYYRPPWPVPTEYPVCCMSFESGRKIMLFFSLDVQCLTRMQGQRVLWVLRGTITIGKCIVEHDCILPTPCVIEFQQVFAEMPIYLSNKIASECAMIYILKTMLQ